MRTVLVCVRTPLAAHNVAVMAARLGLSAVVRTAASESEAMMRLAERACDVVLADTGLARPDPAAFVRRVLARAPGATVLLIGAEERAAAAAAIAAGARGLVQADSGDLMSGVVKAMLLLAASPRARRAAVPQGVAGSAPSIPSIATGRGGPQDGRGERDRREADERPSDSTNDPGATESPAMVPAQRGDDTADTAICADPNEADGDAPARSAAPGNLLGGDYSRGGLVHRADAATPGASGRPSGAGGGGVLGTARRLPGVTPTAGAMGPSAAAGTTSAATGVPGTASMPRATATSGAANIPTPPAPGAAAPQPAPPITLTEREMQVLIGMAEGKSNAEIGRELFVSEDTVKTHARRLFRKLGARDRAHAVAAGFRAGLVA